MNKKTVSALLAIVLSLTGCYYTADPDYVSEQQSEIATDSEHREKAEQDPSAQQEESKEAVGDEITAESYLLEYVPKIYEIGEEYSFYLDGGKDFCFDLNYTLTEYHFGDRKLSPEFDYLNEEDRVDFNCEEDEFLVYYTLEITAGARQTADVVMMGSNKLISVTKDAKGNLNAEQISANVFGPAFAPCENYASTHDKGKVTLKAGETVTLLCVEKMKERYLEAPIYLCISPMGSSIFEDTGTDRSKLSDEERASVGLYQIQAGEEVKGKTGSFEEAVQDTDYRWSVWYQNCPKVQSGEEHRFTDAVMARDFSIVMKDASIENRSSIPYIGLEDDRLPAVHEDGSLEEGFAAIAVTWEITAGEGQNQYEAPLRMKEETYLVAEIEGHFHEVSAFSCDDLHEVTEDGSTFFRYSILPPGQTTQVGTEYIIPAFYLEESEHLYIMVSLAAGGPLGPEQAPDLSQEERDAFDPADGKVFLFPLEELIVQGESG